MQHEIVGERRRSADLEALVRRMRTDLHEATQFIQDPKALKARRLLCFVCVVSLPLFLSFSLSFPVSCTDTTLQDAVRALYQKHVSESLGEHGLDVDIQREYTRQREYLERTVSGLKTKLGKQGERHKQDSVRVLQENVALIKCAVTAFWLEWWWLMRLGVGRSTNCGVSSRAFEWRSASAKCLARPRRRTSLSTMYG
jgi:hypothetical protein